MKTYNKSKHYCKNGIFVIDYNDYVDNSYYQQDPQMFMLLCKILNSKKLHSCSRTLILKKHCKLLNWIYVMTPKLYDCKLTERLFWILNDIHDFPRCLNPQCKHSLNSSNFKCLSIGYIQYCSVKCRTSSPFPYAKAKITASLRSEEQNKAIVEKTLATKRRHAEEDPTYKDRILQKSIETRKKNNGEDYTGRKKCKQTLKDRYGVENPMHTDIGREHLKQHNLKTYGVEWHIAAPSIREKSRQTCNKNYGVDHPFASKEIREQMKEKNLKLYGVEYNWQREDVKQHIKDTNKRLYGYENAMQNPEIRAKSQMNIIYDNKSFDSYPEVCLYIWLIDHKITFEFQPNISFQYEYNGKLHYYCPDFKIGDVFYEIKGNYFFKDKDSTKEMICPWDHSLDGLYEAKHQCMLKNNVVIYDSYAYQKYLDYVDDKYGKTFYTTLKQQKQQRKHRNTDDESK